MTEKGEQTDRQTDNRKSNYRPHSSCQWIVGLSWPILRGDFKDREQTLPVGDLFEIEFDNENSTTGYIQPKYISGVVKYISGGDS